MVNIKNTEKGFYATLEEIKYYFPLSYRRFKRINGYKDSTPFSQIKDIEVGVSLSDTYVRVWANPGTKNAKMLEKRLLDVMPTEKYNFILSKIKEKED